MMRMWDLRHVSNILKEFCAIERDSTVGKLTLLRPIPTLYIGVPRSA